MANQQFRFNGPVELSVVMPIVLLKLNRPRGERKSRPLLKCSPTTMGNWYYD